MADNRDAIALALVAWVQNLFSAEPVDIELFLTAWENHLNVYTDTKSNIGNRLDELIENLKQYSEEKYNICSKEGINNYEWDFKERM